MKRLFVCHLADILSPLTGKSDYTVTNSSHFVSTISHERIQENEVMVSFDVESLFTNVPIEGAVKAALCKLENDPGLADRTNLTPTQIADLLNFVLKSTYFQYNGSIYEQKDGAAMGSLGSVSSRECLDASAILATFTAGRTGLVIV